MDKAGGRVVQKSMTPKHLAGASREGSEGSSHEVGRAGSMDKGHSGVKVKFGGPEGTLQVRGAKTEKH